MIVAIGSHPDDVQLGCGATLRQLASAGYRVAVVVVTNGEQTSLSDGIDRTQSIGERRQTEVRAGFEHLDIDDVTFLGLPDLGVSVPELVDRLPEFDEHVDLIFTHSSNDSHPDHRATAEAVGLRYDESKILHMESPSTAGLSAPKLLVDVAGAHEEKIRAIQEHESQSHKEYMTPEAVRENLAHAGTHLDSEFVERFEMEVPNPGRFEGLFDAPTTVVAPTPNPVTGIGE